MYEAKQNKEKVSRRIEGGGRARQRVKRNESLSAKIIQKVMWYMTDDHSKAIELLARENKGFFGKMENYNAFGTSSLLFDNSDVITLWGHTLNNTEFGGYTPDALVNNLISLGLKKSKHKTLNIISCSPNMTFEKEVMTYAQKIQSLLSDNGINLTVKTLPMVEVGRGSVLYRCENLKQIAYITYSLGKEKYVADVFKRNSYLNALSILKKDEDIKILNMKFSNILNKLEEVRIVKQEQKSPLKHPLLPDVFYGKPASM